MTLSVILPAYQEAENLKSILPRIKKVVEDLNVEYEILVIDTMNSMDETEDICKEYNILYFHRMYDNSYGSAIRTGIERSKGNYIVFMDADGSHDPAEIKNMYDLIASNDADLVIGSRYCKGGYTDNNFVLRFMSWILNVTYRLFFKLNVKDVSDSYRMYRGDQLRDLQLECNNFDIVEEILIKLNYTFDGIRIKEIPISFSKRAFGESKRDLVKFIFSYLTTMRKLLAIKRRMRQ